VYSTLFKKRKEKKKKKSVNSTLIAASKVEKGNPMYTNYNFKTKKALKDAVSNGVKVTLYQAGPFGGNDPTSGTHCVEGPHYPQPHTWYASVTLDAQGYVIKVK
jgi:hypothetical protein